MLGMIFGVAAVIAMLSIGAGAQQQMIAFIQQLGVRNVIVEARETTDPAAFTKTRKLSAGLSFRDVRMIQSSLEGISAVTARKRFTPSKLLPKPYGDVPVVYGVSPVYEGIAGLAIARGRFFTAEESDAAAPVAVLGQAAAAGFFGSEEPLGRFIKVNDTWYRVIGVVRPQIAVQGDAGGLPAQDQNNLIYVPLMSAIMRIEDAIGVLQGRNRRHLHRRWPATTAWRRPASWCAGLLDTTHNGAGDFTIIVPAELLAQQERTKRLFEFVMVAIASISLLVGGIGIMNIMLASVMERTREIGVRRAVGARKVDVIRQFLIETTLITVSGGFAGTVVGHRAVAADWVSGGLVDDRHGVIGGDRHGRVRDRRHRVRSVPGRARRAPQSGRRPALRIIRAGYTIGRVSRDLRARPAVRFP